MKLVLLSDTHIVKTGTTLFGLNPINRLVEVIQCINDHHSDADLCVITGDLTQNGEENEFKCLYKCLSTLKIPYQLLIGNHDNKENFLRIFKNHKPDTNGFIQSIRKTPVGIMIFLDTNIEGTHVGWYCEKRQKWLAHQLEIHKDSSIFLFMHHPPFSVFSPNLDKTMLRQQDAFKAILDPYLNNIKHIFFGHIHKLIAGSWFNIPISAIRGTNHQRQKNTMLLQNFSKEHGAPFYSVAYIQQDFVCVQFYDTQVYE